MKTHFYIKTSTFATLCCFIVVGMLGIYLKMALLEDQWLSIARFLGMVSGQQITPLERLGFYSSDIGINLVVIPLVGTALVSAVFRRHQAGAATVIAICLVILLFYELRAQTTVGQYVSRAFLIDSIHFGISNPQTAGDYLTPASMVKLAILFAILLITWFIARAAARAEAKGNSRRAVTFRRLLAVPAAGVLCAAVLILPVAFAQRLQGSLLNVSSTTRVVRALVGSSRDLGTKGLDFEHALAATRQLSVTPALDDHNPLVGSERGDNVLLFVMETGPAQALELKTSAPTLPGVLPLLQHAFIANRHFTTYPYTSNAVYSILSGMYPQGRRRLLADLNKPSLNGLMTAIKRDVPIRNVYMPSLYLSEVDDQMYEAFGASELYIADQHTKDSLHRAAEHRADELISQLIQKKGHFESATRNLLHTRLVQDFQALEKLKADIVSASLGRQSFCMAFLPQVAHGPWIALHDETTVLQRGHDLMLLEDQWLREIVDTLRKAGQLDHTIIVFTADHGIRTRAEDPALPIGKISDYMFRVPLMIYAPHALQRTVFIDTPTSHIDVTPTVLALLGTTSPASEMEGIPIWQRRPNNRIYFWAYDYGGVDGFEQNDRYYMRQELSGVEFTSDYSGFYSGFPDTAVDHDRRRNKFVSMELSEANTLQEAIVSDWIRDEQVHEH